MDDQPPNESRPGIPAWVWILALFAIILGLNFFLNNRFASAARIDLTEAMNRIKAGDVTRVTLTGSRLTLTLENNEELVTTVDARGSLEETLAFYGVTTDTLQEYNVDLAINDQTVWQNVLSIVLTIGPFLLLIWIFSRGFRQMQGGGGNSIF
ncbi:MAG: ATP-dependent metallopeptidase FtsH/Yme1/Tma family protein, partial [Anaerolineales bacterium]|nr:ATP-dependent metallopeptidase FtsH/Yme1/Tma family protein [Anaerolineales bacterium]